MPDVTEKALVAAFAARMARINGTGDYLVDISNNTLQQRIDFSAETESMPLVGVVASSGSFEDEGVSPRYASQETEIELVGCIKAGNEDRTKPLDLLLDMKRAAFAPNNDIVDQCVSYLRARDWAVFLAQRGEQFTQVSLYLVARWGDESVTQDGD